MKFESEKAEIGPLDEAVDLYVIDVVYSVKILGFFFI